MTNEKDNGYPARLKNFKCKGPFAEYYDNSLEGVIDITSIRPAPVGKWQAGDPDGKIAYDDKDQLATICEPTFDLIFGSDIHHVRFAFNFFGLYVS